MTKKKLIKYIKNMSDSAYEKWLIEHNLKRVDGDWILLKFEEFWKTFPQKTPRGRALRALSLSAKKAKAALALFKKEIASPEEADLAIRGLKLELLNRARTNELEYINNIQTYIRNKNWELYQDPDEKIDDLPNIDMEEGSNFSIL
jgi:hypothetical protein